MIDLTAVSRVYDTGSSMATVALHDVDLHIDAGEFVVVVGASGSGKSTLLNLVGCIDRPTSGEVSVGGRVTSSQNDRQLSRMRNRTVGMVFQMFNLIPEMSLRQNVELPLIYAGVGRERRVLAAEALHRVGLGRWAEQPVRRLSGGEQQRVAIARALVNDPPVILADEPTGSLDFAGTQQILELLGELNTQGRTVVVVTHSSEVASWGRRAVRLIRGSISAHPTPLTLLRGTETLDQRAGVLTEPAG